jgi:hypothetical protein
VFVVEQITICGVAWHGLRDRGWREPHPIWGTFAFTSLLLAMGLRFGAAAFLLPPVLLYLRAILPGR